MNLSKLALAAALAAVSGAMAFAPTANAATVTSTGGTITISGKVIDATCSFGASGADQTVSLANVSTSNLTALGQYSGVSKAFTIDLKDCPTNSKVGVQFYSSNADTTTGNGTLSNTGSAGGVDVQIVDSSSTAVSIASTAPTDDTGVSDQTDMSTNSGTASLAYTAYYYVTDVSAVTGGSVSSTTQYVLNYQ
ncbi:MAG TPA: fimbrial protein [Rhodanobacteraceae bacterium]